MIIKELKGNEIYYDVSPMTYEHYDIKDILKIEMTSGGGMGGRHITMLVNPVIIEDNCLNTVTNAITGEFEIINSRYITSIKFRQLIKLEYIHYNSNFEKSYGKLLTNYYVSKRENIKFKEEYKSIEDWCY